MARATNADYIRDNAYFIHICSLVKIDPTPRQAGKFRRKKGLAYEHHLKISHTRKIKVNSEVTYHFTKRRLLWLYI